MRLVSMLLAIVLPSISLHAQVSDDFNAPTLKPFWRLVAPAGGSFALAGQGTGEAVLTLSVPGGATHDLWIANASAPMLLQAVAAGDWEIEACFVGSPAGADAAQGIVVRESAARFLRFDIDSSSASSIKLVVSVVLDGVVVKPLAGLVITPGPRTWLRLGHAGKTWTCRYSLDGVVWILAASFVAETFAPAEAGVFVRNSNTNPAFTSKVDYFFNSTSPIVPEDAVEAEEPPPPPGIVMSIMVSWDPVTTDVEGKPEVVGGYELATSAATADLNAGGVPLMRMEVPVGAETGTEIISMVRAARPAETCRVWCRARDVDGYWSAWSDPITVGVPRDTCPPVAPRGMRVR